MVDVGVGQNDRVQLSGRAVELLILRKSVIAFALKQAAVEQYSSGACFDQMLTASDFTSGAQECDSHFVNT